MSGSICEHLPHISFPYTLEGNLGLICQTSILVKTSQQNFSSPFFFFPFFIEIHFSADLEETFQRYPRKTASKTRNHYHNGIQHVRIRQSTTATEVFLSVCQAHRPLNNIPHLIPLCKESTKEFINPPPPQKKVLSNTELELQSI